MVSTKAKSGWIAVVLFSLVTTSLAWATEPPVDEDEEDPSVDSICGWDVRQDRVTLIGTVTRIDYWGGLFGDRDWSLFIQPDPQYEYLLINSSGHRNRDGLIECEVQPRFLIGRDWAADRRTMNSYFGPLVGKRVTVEGTWAEEDGWCHHGKTEIHPIVSVLQKDDPIGFGASYKTQFLVFSNSSNFDPIIRPRLPPFNHRSMFGSFHVPFPPPLDDMNPDGVVAFQILREVDMAANKQFLVTRGRPGVLTVNVESGVESHGQGFYFAEIEVGTAAAFVSQSVPRTMNAGQTYDVSVTMRNLSGGYWYAGEIEGFRLGSQNPQDNMTWGRNRVHVPYTAPLANAVFTFQLTAPRVAGVYNFQWRMVREGLFSSRGWFGELTPNVQVSVIPPLLRLTPDSGPMAGGTPVTIVGEGFEPGAAVTFGGFPATQVTYVNGSTLVATTPAHGLGAVDVAVTIRRQTASMPNAFTYFVEPVQIMSVVNTILQ